MVQRVEYILSMAEINGKMMTKEDMGPEVISTTFPLQFTKMAAFCPYDFSLGFHKFPEGIDAW
jgi:hypothetical protein